MSGRELLQQLTHNPKVAAGVAAMTTGTGAGTVLDWIPDDIGKLAVIVGIMVSIMILRVQRVTLKKEQLELQIMKDKEAERKEAAELRKETGQPLRREAD